MIQNDSVAYNGWLKPGADIYRKYYLFNVTNPDAVEKGTEKPRLVECGPYVYQEVWEKRNVTFLDEETVSYIPITTLHFVPELSNGSLSDNINFINVPALVSHSNHIERIYMGNT